MGVIVAALAVVALSTSASVAPATQPGSLRLSVTPRVVPPTGRIFVRATNLQPGSNASLTVAGVTRRVTANSAGKVSLQVHVPANALPRANVVQLRQAGTSVSAAIDVRVDWRTAGRDNAHSSVNPWERTVGEASVGDVARRWHTKLSKTDRLSNLVTAVSTYGDYGYTCTGAGDVTKLDLRTGAILWQTSVPSDPDQLKTCRTGGVFNDGQGHVWVGGLRLEDLTGGRASQDGGLGGPGSEPAVTGGVLVAGGSPTDCSGLGAAEVATGRVLWRSDLGGCGSAVMGGVVVASDGMNLLGLDVKSGVVRWDWSGTDRGGFVGSLSGNSTTAVANVNGEVTAINPTTGEKIWSVPEAKPLETAFTVSNDTVYYAAGYGVNSVEAVALSLSDGSVRWRVPLATNPGPRLSLANGLLYAGGKSINAFDAMTGKLTQSISVSDVEKGIEVATVVPVNGHLYVGTNVGILDYAASTTP